MNREVAIFHRRNKKATKLEECRREKRQNSKYEARFLHRVPIWKLKSLAITLGTVSVRKKETKCSEERQAIPPSTDDGKDEQIGRLRFFVLRY